MVEYEYTNNAKYSETKLTWFCRLL